MWSAALPLLSLPHHWSVAHAPPSSARPLANPRFAPLLSVPADLYANDALSTKLLVWCVVLLDVANTAMNGEQLFHYGTDQHRDFYSVAIRKLIPVSHATPSLQPCTD